MKVVFAWIAILSVVSVTALSFPYNECGGSEIICKNLQIDLDGQPTKGNAIGMSWKLECGQHEFINNLHIYVAFNGFSFHEEDTPQNVEVSGGAQAEVKYSVTIPSFAPSGHYQVNLTAQGNPEDPSKSDVSFNCISVEFDL